MLNLADFLRNLARFGTLLLGFSMICVTLFQGAISYGISIEYILWNLPNALPYFLLLFTLLIAWDYELAGGVIMLVLGIAAKYYLHSNTHSSNLDAILVITTIVFSLSFIGSWIIRKIHSITLA